MIIKGKSRTGPEVLGPYLQNAEKNERVSVLEIKGTISQDLIGALLEMDAYAEGTQCEKPLYHAQMSPEPPYRLTHEQCMEAVDALEKELGLTGHPRVVVMHEKLGRQHFHPVWTRIDLETMRAVPDSHNYRKHEQVSRDLERRFGHPRVQGAHAERDGVERPDRTPSRAELRQQERTGIKGKHVKAEVTAIFRASDNAEAFKAGLELRSYILARGDSRDFVIADRAGGIHSLGRRIEGMKAADLREFMSSIDRESLPTAEQARVLAEGRAEQREEARREKAYGRGDDYVSQTQAALKDHSSRQEGLDRRYDEEMAQRRAAEDELLRRQAEETTRQQQAEQARNTTQSGFKNSSAEMTDAKQEQLQRFLNSVHEDDRFEERDHPDPDRQREAPGGGRTRSR